MDLLTGIPYKPKHCSKISLIFECVSLEKITIHESYPLRFLISIFSCIGNSSNKFLFSGSSINDVLKETLSFALSINDLH